MNTNNNNMNNSQQYKVLSGKDNVYIENTKAKKVICIDRSYYSFRLVTDYQELVETEFIDLKNVDSLLGIIEIESLKYLLVIWKSRPVSQFLNIEINTIVEVDLILLSYTEANPYSKEILRKYLKLVLSNGFYYSNGFDLTRSLQEKEEFAMQTSGSNKFLSLKNCNRDFMWNYQLIQPLLMYNVDESFISCCIYGYVTSISKTIQSIPIEFTLISKRLTHQYTVYTNNLGLMELNTSSGNRFCCKDFVETECITQLKSNVFSFILCSSTIPVYYSQSKTNEVTYKHLTSYLNDLLHKYRNVSLVNINDSTKPEESELKKAFGEMVKAYANKAVNRLEVDTSALLDCDIFVKDNSGLCDFLGFYGRYSEQLRFQQGVFYLISNNTCDTKNDFMMALAWYYFNKESELIGLGLNSPPKELDLLGLSAKSNQNIESNDKEDLMALFHEKWSRHKKALQFERNPPAPNYHIQVINQRILDYLIDDNSIKRKYLQNKKINIFVGTWNSAGIDPSPSYDLSDWFMKNVQRETNPHYAPDLILIGMQEIVELNASNILIKSNEEKVRQWKGLIYKGINKAFPKEEYFPIKDLHLVGILLICFTKKGIDPIIKQSIIHKTGAFGTMGNKGSCLISISYHSSSIAFATGHFAAGQKSNESRISQLIEILNMHLSTASNTKVRLRDFTHWFIFGDVNFRVDREYEEAINHLNQLDINHLLKCDQFLTVKSSTNLFNDLSEGQISFPPTYQYVFGSDEYEKKKLRIPSWCDRIFYKSSNDVRLFEYNIVRNVKYSDHRPVYAIFDLNCAQSIDNEKAIIIEEIKSHEEACNQQAFTIENAIISINQHTEDHPSPLQNNNLLGL